MRYVLLIIMVVITAAATAQQIVVPFSEQDATFSLVRKYSKEKVLEGFNRIEYIGDSIYLVWKNGHAGLVHVSGKELVPLAYHQVPTIVEFREGMFPLKDDSNRIFYFDRTGRKAFEWKFAPPQFTYFFNGLIETPKGFMNKQGKLVGKPYDRVTAWTNGLFQVGNFNAKGELIWGVIDSRMRVIVPIKFEELDMDDEYITASRTDLLCSSPGDIVEIYDLKGKLLLKGHYPYLSMLKPSDLFSYSGSDDGEGEWLCRISDRRKLADNYSMYYPLTKDRILAIRNVWVNLPDSGFFILNSDARVIHRFGNGMQADVRGLGETMLAFTDSSGLRCAADANGKTMFCLPADVGFWLKAYDKFYEVGNDKTKLIGCVDNTGKIIIPIEYKYVITYPELGLWKVRKDKGEYFVDDKGNAYYD